eukprot:3900940-Pyramimonas_sp.AAC.1
MKPRKIPKIVEEGIGDCGDGRKGLGYSAYCADVPFDFDTEGDDEEEVCIALPAGLFAEFYADVFSIVPTLSYGRHNK